MQGKIDENGNLLILRRDKWKSQYCPKRLGRCGDGCPKFGEPYSAFVTNLEGERIDGVALKLCENDRLFFTQFSDDR